MNVALTGWGILSSLGTTREQFAEGVRAGRSGIAPIQRFDTSRYASHLAAMIPAAVDYKRHIPPARLRRMDLLTRQLVYVACEAFHHASPAARAVPPERRAVVVGSGMNHTESIEQFFVSLLEQGPDGANPILFPSTIPNSGSGLIAIELECRGPNLTITQKETSAEMALVAAADLLQSDQADVVLVAAGESLTAAVFDGLATLQALSRARAGQGEGMWPFSRRRNGFVAGEGAAAVVLERAGDAQAAGLPVLARLVGAVECAQPCPAIKFPSDPKPLVVAVEHLLAATGNDPGSIAFVNAAANSTKSVDDCEAQIIPTIAATMGRPSSEIPIAAVKASIGEFCASGLTRILAALVALEVGLCPPLPFDAADHDPEFDLRFSYRDRLVHTQGTDVLHLASAAGGHQMALRFSTAGQ